MPAKKYMGYDPGNIPRALAMVRKGHSIHEAAVSCGIPASTVRDKLRCTHPRSKPGAPTVLSPDVENRAVSWILDMAKRGFPVNTRKLTDYVAQNIRDSGKVTKFKNGVPGKKWVKHFLQRHPNIARRVPSVLPKYRAIVKEGQIRSWFKEIGDFIELEGFQDVLLDPSRIFNMDETAVRTIPTKDVVLAEVGSRYVHARVGNSDKESYTALFGASASGILAPTLILYPYKQRIPGEIFRKLPQGWAAGKTETGWMNRDTFFLYLRDVFYPYLLESNIQFPVILFVDGHKSHVSHLSTEFCKKSRIILVCLHPNTTQITQPLDVCFFRPLKVHWNQLLVAWRIDNRGELLPKSEIAPLLKQAVDKMENLATTLANGFRRCGLYPFNSDSVNYSSLTSGKPDEPMGDSRSSPMRVAEPETDNINHIGCLEQLESFLSPQQLQCFKQQTDMENWTGPIEDTGLYLVWNKMGGERGTALVSGAEVDPLDSDGEVPPFFGFPEGNTETAAPSKQMKSIEA